MSHAVAAPRLRTSSEPFQDVERYGNHDTGFERKLHLTARSADLVRASIAQLGSAGTTDADQPRCRPVRGHPGPRTQSSSTTTSWAPTTRRATSGLRGSAVED